MLMLLARPINWIRREWPRLWAATEYRMTYAEWRAGTSAAEPWATLASVSREERTAAVNVARAVTGIYAMAWNLKAAIQNEPIHFPCACDCGCEVSLGYRGDCAMCRHGLHAEEAPAPNPFRKAMPAWLLAGKVARHG